MARTVIYQPKTQAGDVLHVTRFNGRRTNSLALVTRVTSGSHVVWLTGYPRSGNYVARIMKDTYTIVPPEEWPDEVCAAVALFQLTGKLDPSN